MAGLKQTTDLLLPQIQSGDQASVKKWADEMIIQLSTLLSDLVFNLNEVIDGKLDQVQFTVVTAEPADKAEGWVVFADGTSWNPGSGRGLYEYRSGAWNKL